MINTVFVLGAGTSKSSGAPLMNDFLDTASKLLALDIIKDGVDDFKMVFDTIRSLQQVHSKSQLDLNNIESIFTTFELGKILKKLPGKNPADIPRVIKALKVLIYKTLEESIFFPTETNYIHPTQSYSNFCDLLVKMREKFSPKHQLSIITFNYDIGMDMAMFSHGLGPYYGFQKEEQGDLTPLYKLHGSLNWATQTEDRQVIPLHLRDYFRVYSYHGFETRSKCKIPIGSQLSEYFQKRNIAVDDEPVIIPPSWNKSSYHEAISEVWAKAALSFQNADNIVIIGYSLPDTDAFFKLLFALGTVGDTLLKNVIVINPGKIDEIGKRFEQIMGPAAIARYKYLVLKFEDSISSIEELLR